jgi:hypothetical protein
MDLLNRDPKCFLHLIVFFPATGWQISFLSLLALCLGVSTFLLFRNIQRRRQLTRIFSPPAQDDFIENMGAQDSSADEMLPLR